MPSVPRDTSPPRFAVVEAKIKPPGNPDWLERPRCLAQLESVFNAKLSLVLAPTGSGKTTLLAQWIAQLPQNVSWAWLNVEPGDNDVGRFYFNLLSAVQRNVPSFKGYMISHLEQADSIADDMIDAIAALLAKLSQPLVIVLDDMQWISNNIILTTLQRFIALLPPNCHMVWSSRHAPPFSTTRLKLESQLFQLEHDSLGFTRDDIALLAQKLNGQSLSEQQSEHLLQTTEGWIAGIKLALLGGQLAGTPEHFSGAHRDVVDYLGSAVLAQLDTALEEFLLQTAILNRFSAPLCDALLQRADSARVLQTLLYQQLFVQALDGQNCWLRYHALFREFLHNQLQLKHASLIPVLHTRAALWFSQQGDHEAALTHARMSCDPQTRDHILENAFRIWFKLGEFNRILQWSDMLDESPPLQPNRSMGHLIAALLFARRFNQATYYLDQLTLRATRECDNEAQMLTRFLSHALEFFLNDDAFRIAEPAITDYSSYSIDLLYFSQIMHAYYLLLHHNFPQALREAETARIHLKQTGHHFLASFGTMIEVLVDREQCNMFDALNRTEQACAALCDARTPEWINLHSVLAVVRYEQNRITEAAELCRELLPLLSGTCTTEVITAVYLTLTRICASRSAMREGSALLKHLARILALGYYDRFTALIHMEKARLAYVTGELQDIAYDIGQLRLVERWRNGEWRQPRTYEESWHRHGQALVYWFMASGCETDAQGILETLAASAEHADCKRQYVILQAMRAVCYQRMTQPTAAMCCVLDALKRGGWASITRSVFDEAPGFSELLKQAIEQKMVQNVPASFCNVYADILQCQNLKTRQNKMHDPFTDKEAEIVALLSEGLSNKAISERAGIALATTKWHLKNIYTKLNVQTRTEAVIKLEFS